MPPPDPDAILRRVLATGCGAGLDGVSALVGNPQAPWAEPVLRLCSEILRSRALSRPPAVVQVDDELAVERLARRSDSGAHDGRGRLVLWSSLYGIWLGVATDVMFRIDNGRQIVLAPLIGMAAGLVLSLQLTSNEPVTTGQAWTIITGFDYGTINGALWAAAFDASSKGVVGTALTSGFAATAAGLAVADATHPSAGDIELVRSALLWGGLAGFLSVAAFSPGPDLSGPHAALGSAIAMDAGFVLGIGLARRLELSRNRVLVLDAGALAGGLTGLAVAWMASSDNGPSRRAWTGATLGGLAAGIVLAAIATRDMDRQRELAEDGPAAPAFWARSSRGHWGPGTPAPVPVVDGPGHRLVGATLGMLGGAF